MDLASMIAGLYGKDTAASYDALKELESLSDSSNLLYPYIDSFIDMLSSDKYVVRVRGFRLLCKQAKWDEDNIIDEEIDVILRAVDDEKPTAVRQALQYLRFVVPYKKELCNKIKQAACTIDYSRYKDTMQPLIAKDVQSLLRDIDGLKEKE